MSRLTLSLLVSVVLLQSAIGALAAPVTSADQLVGTWRGSCNQMGSYTDAGGAGLSCVPDGLLNFYEVVFQAGSYTWSGSAVNSTQGATEYFLPAAGQEQTYTLRNDGNGGITTTEQPCFFVDIEGDKYIEYGQYNLADYSGTSTCPANPSNPLPACGGSTFTYICHAWKVQAATPAPSSANALAFTPIVVFLAAFIALFGF